MGGVTVATNMAGRGVDIVLGGAMPEKPEGKTNEEWQESKEMAVWREHHEKVLKAGGLHVLGTERHEARRVDNQLRGRSGRQGDPGSSRFFLSLEDDLMRIFGGEQISGLMDKLKLPEDQPIENALVSRAIEQSQVKVEGFHFDMRKRLVEFDDVANQQREIVYKLRRRVLDAQDVKDEVLEKLNERAEKIVEASWPEFEAKPNVEKMIISFLDIVPFDDASRERIEGEVEKRNNKEEVKELLKKVIADIHKTREGQVGKETMRQIEKYAYLGSIDHHWIDHIDHIDDLREAITLRAYGQRDPLIEFKNEAFQLFENLIERINVELSGRLFRIGVAQPQSEIPLSRARMNVDKGDQTGLKGEADAAVESGKPAFEGKTEKKMGRNDPCWCGSGKKWKKCHYPQMQ